MKRYKLKESVKGKLAIGFLFLVVIVGSIVMGNRFNDLNQKKTDTQTYISQK